MPRLQVYSEAIPMRCSKCRGPMVFLYRALVRGKLVRVYECLDCGNRVYV